MSIQDQNRLRFAIPNKGRLNQPTIELLKRSGYSFRVTERALYATCTNDEIVFIFLRTEDIPVLVSKKIVDLGVTGQDLVLEKKAVISEVLPLDFGKCRLCVAASDTLPEGDLSFLNNKTVATSFTEITNQFLKSKNITTEVVELSGSVEIMIGLGLATAIVDIVETGDSLRANGLKVIETIGSYETSLITHPSLANDPRILKIKRRIEGILIADKYSLLEYNIPEMKLKEAEKLTPGFESPTLSPLEEKGWVAVRVMVEKKMVPETMDKLELLGATAIMQTAIHNCRL